MNRLFTAILLLIAQFSLAQAPVIPNPLPDFSVTTRGGGKIIIGWQNAYPNVTQISIQRSFDSLRNFKTLLTVPDPTVPQNGFVDSKAPTEFQYYRLFIVLDSGKYLFTRSKKAILDTSRVVVQKPAPKPQDNGRIIQQQPLPPIKENNNSVPVEKPVEPERIFYVKKADSVIGQLNERDIRRFRDSILQKTKDTLVIRTADTFLIKPFIPREVYKPSPYVFTARDGNITIALPDVSSKKYSIRFFEAETQLFELKQINQSPLTLDKANFLHSGWFRFELYENGQLKERHRFYIPKDF
ncbi:MAG TPA: hypothetical protein VGD17_14535 [Chitinophagaceae bacterium]